MAQSCISLATSTTCSGFNASSISTDSTLSGLFSFLSSVTDTATFDSGLTNYISGAFSRERYDTLIGCSKSTTGNSTDFYARYTTSVLCNAIVQNSIDACGLTGNATRPLCADSCAEYAQSEQEITDSSICGTAGSNALTQIRADFTNCALPANSITGSCIEAVHNQPDNCGFSDNLTGLCSYCAASSPNSTDTCCYNSDTETRCTDVTLPVIASASSSVTFTVTASSSTNGATAGAAAGDSSNNGLSKGAIAGIVIGSILGALLLLGLIIGACLLMRRRRDHSPATSVFNQPATGRGMQAQPQMAYAADGSRDGNGGQLSPLAGGRVARMSALEGSSSEDPHQGRDPYIGYAKDEYDDDDDEDMPMSRGGLAVAPLPKRSGSLSSNSQLGLSGTDMQDTSPSSGAEYTSPESQGQSEQLNFFKDYYSQDEIHPDDLVATLWAYEPRAADEFQLERGDMIKVLGIWDDGWATGVRVRQRADDWRPEEKIQRDSALSNQPPQDTANDGEVKAFPLVCVCLPQYWRKTIEGDTTDGSGGPGGGFPPERGS